MTPSRPGLPFSRLCALDARERRAWLRPGVLVGLCGSVLVLGRAPAPARSGAAVAPDRRPLRCAVPKLEGDTPSGARRALGRAHCVLGGLRRRRSQHVGNGRVIAQRPAPGSVLAASAPVTITLSSGRAGRARATVAIAGFAYRPRKLTVSGGARVTWTNRDSTLHSASADRGGAFDTGRLDHRQSRTVTFSKAGRFDYHCVFHPFMAATVTVI